MSRRIPGFNAEASLFTSSKKHITLGYRNPVVSPQILPQVLQNPFRPRAPIVVKSPCSKICFIVGGVRKCWFIC
jgi:hypothetical protein